MVAQVSCSWGHLSPASPNSWAIQQLVPKPALLPPELPSARCQPLAGHAAGRLLGSVHLAQPGTELFISTILGHHFTDEKHRWSNGYSNKKNVVSIAFVSKWVK